MRFSLNFIKEFVRVDLPADRLAYLLTMAGLEVELFQRQASDWVFDIEVTSNRYDWLSIIGIAREVASLTHKKLKISYPEVTKKPKLQGREIIISDTEDCPFYIGRVIRAVKVNEPGERLKERVTHCGLNSVNNIVDITNYCMLKWGNPLHAFDEDKLEGNIYIRRARKGELFVGIDDKERVLSKENLVIADDKKVIALAGVMGAKNTEVDEGTKNVFLEAAIFSSITIRRSRRLAGVDTDSSFRFERRVCADYLEYASAEAHRLVEELTGGNFLGYKEAGKKPLVRKKTIHVSVAALQSYLGGYFAKQKVTSILGNLGCKVKSRTKNVLLVEPPAYRFDIEREVDIYEEFIRIHGYDKIEHRLPSLVTHKKDRGAFAFKNELRRLLASLSFKEVITYSIEAEKDLARLKESGYICLKNPLREEENALRPTLLLGMIEVLRYNANRNQDDLRLFEVANIYRKVEECVCEDSHLAIAVTGIPEGFFYLKGIVEELLRQLTFESVQLKEESLANFTNALNIEVKGKSIGFLGKLNERFINEFDVKSSLFFAELDTELLRRLRGQKIYRPISSYPALWRDISIALRRDLKFKDIEAVVYEKGRHITCLRIIDTYQGKDLPEGFGAFTLRIFYQSQAGTLTSREVDSCQSAIRDALSMREGILLR